MADRVTEQAASTRRRGRLHSGLLTRSLLLATVALAAALYWLAKDSPMIAADLQQYGLMSLGFVGLPILLAAAFIGVARLLRRRRR